MLDLLNVDDFGSIDADTDSLLGECFQSHPAYLSAKQNEKFLILDRKGSGKTAIYKRFVDEPEYGEEFAYGYSFDDYPWEHHDLQAQIGVPEERRYFHSWKYFTLVNLSRILLNLDLSQPWSDQSLDSIRVLEDFIVDSYGSRDPDVGQLFSPDKELHLKGLVKLPFFEGSGERVPVQELPPHIQEVNREVQKHVLNALNPEKKYYICYDQLDLGFAKNSEPYTHRLIGLILAARDLFLAARKKGKNLNVVVFLRDDIYQDLQFEDKNKITENLVERVQWHENDGGLTLKGLMESRFNNLLGGGEGASIAWESVFDESKEMPSRQRKYKHICDRTFLRPRDMIKFCNEILKQYKSVSQGRREAQFDNAAVHEARAGYSDYLLNELDDEIAKHVPQYKEYLEALKEVGSLQFSLGDFKDALRRRFSTSEVEPISALQQLFEFSVVAYLKPGGRGGGSEYVWRYRDPRARFNSASEVFRIHPGFKEALDLSRQSS